MRAMRAGHWVVSALTADCTSFLVHWKIVTLCHCGVVTMVSLWCDCLCVCVCVCACVCVRGPGNRVRGLCK